MRFTGVTIPQGSAIVNAWVQFKVDETGFSATSVNVQGQAADNPLTFTTAANNITLRPRTVASVNWVPAPWTVLGEAGPAQRTPNLASVIQEIVSQPGWLSGNSLVLIITGTGKRTAESFNGDAAGAALLHVEYGGGGNLPPSVSAGGDQTIILPSSANLDGTVTDDGQPGPLTTTWSMFSGPGTVSFGDASAVDTTASFSTAGVYTLRLTTNDGAVSVSDDIVVTVNAAGNQPPSVNAGGDQTITLPASANLDGTVSDAAGPDPSPPPGRCSAAPEPSPSETRARWTRPQLSRSAARTYCASRPTTLSSLPSTRSRSRPSPREPGSCWTCA
jgi:hypothetical protein